MAQHESPRVPREAKRGAVLDPEPDIDVNQAEQRQCETLDLSERSHRFRQRFEPQWTPELPLQRRRPWNVADDPQSGIQRPKRTPRETQQAPRAGNRGRTADKTHEKSQKSRQHAN